MYVGAYLDGPLCTEYLGLLDICTHFQMFVLSDFLPLSPTGNKRRPFSLALMANHDPLFATGPPLMYNLGPGGGLL